MIRLTKKEITDSMFLVIRIGNEEAHYLLRHSDTPFYTAGQYGWNSTVYFFGNVAISTGYHPFGVPASRDRLKRYEEAAKNADSREAVDALLKAFIAEEVADCLERLHPPKDGSLF